MIVRPAGEIQMLQAGHDRGRGNLLGVQPWMTSKDYASEEALSAKLSGYLDAAHRRGWLSARTVVVWPEYIGTWLVATGEGRAVWQADTLEGAMRTLVLGQPLRFARTWLSSSEKDRVVASLFRMRGEVIAELYQAVFSHLAHAYGVTVVGGSLVLPDPCVDDGRVIAGKGQLYSVSAVFGPDGKAHPALVRKVYPTAAERPFLASGQLADLPLFDTPAGRLGVLICADAWYPEPYQRLREQGAGLVVVPSYIEKAGAWDAAWRGYDGVSAPDDVDPADVGSLTEAEAWRKYALVGRLTRSGAEAGLNVFLKGRLWDLGAEGRSVMARAGATPVEAEDDGPAVLNLWV
ncbi:MAG: nitrilase-related carbon-nitrogen hydrolase [Anaerolineae bacterium]